MTAARVGLGTDRHRLQPGHALRLGGVDVPATVAAVGHSDADAVLHALIDALLGAVAAGDIGQLFPDSDPRWKGADSTELLARALEVLPDGLRVENVDVVISLERPKLAPHRDAIRARVAELLGIEIARVSIKAKTAEGLGPVGRGEAVDTTVVVLVELPSA